MNNHHAHTISLRSILGLLGLAVLLIVSPCKVRNAIQAELGIPTTSVSNKSLSAQGNSCLNMDVASSATKITKSIVKQAPTLLGGSLPIANILNFSKLKSYTSDNKDAYTSSVPRYILYRNLKLHL